MEYDKYGFEKGCSDFDVVSEASPYPDEVICTDKDYGYSGPCEAKASGYDDEYHKRLAAFDKISQFYAFDRRKIDDVLTDIRVNAEKLYYYLSTGNII